VRIAMLRSWQVDDVAIGLTVVTTNVVATTKLWLVALAAVEVPGPHPEDDGGRRAALAADHACGPARSALAEHAALDDDDPARAGPVQEPGAPAADGPAADDDGVRARRQGVRHAGCPGASCGLTCTGCPA